MSQKRQILSSIIVVTGILTAISLHGLTAQATNNSAITTPVNGEVTVFDKDQTWNDHTIIDLFKRNELNNQLVYPGVTGQYNFTVQNKVLSPKECQVVIEDENKFDIPLDVRIKKDGVYVLGNETEWVKSANFDSGIYNINGQQKSEYELEWKWDYYVSDENDVRDTALGKHARFENEPYNIKISVYAETEPESSTPESSVPESSTPESSTPESSTPESSIPESSIPESSEPERSIPESSVPQPDDTPPITGDTSNVVIPFAIIILSITIAIIVSKHSQQE